MDRQISNKIKQAMEEKGMTYRALEERTGISRSTLQRYIEKEDSKVSLDSIEKTAMALHMEPSYLMGWNDTISTIDMEKYGLRPIKKIKLPLLGNISCGEPKYADEDRESYIETGTNVNADFCLRANGDSMINAHQKSIIRTFLFERFLRVYKKTPTGINPCRCFLTSNIPPRKIRYSPYRRG